MDNDSLWPLTELEARALAVLVQSERTGSSPYPAPLRAVTESCNRRSGRTPAMDYSDAQVQRALARLQHHALVDARGKVSTTRDPSRLDRVPRIPEHAIVLVIESRSHRTQAFSHRIAEHLEMSEQHLALLCCLILDGPQTASELCEAAARVRLHAHPEAVRAQLEDMALESASAVGALVAPSGSEDRWVELLTRTRWRRSRPSRRHPPHPIDSRQQAQIQSLQADQTRLLGQIDELTAKVERLELELALNRPAPRVR